MKDETLDIILDKLNKLSEYQVSLSDRLAKNESNIDYISRELKTVSLLLERTVNTTHNHVIAYKDKQYKVKSTLELLNTEVNYIKDKLKDKKQFSNKLLFIIISTLASVLLSFIIYTLKKIYGV